MSDPGTRAADRAVAAVERRLLDVYKKAKAEITRTLREYNKRFRAEDAAKHAAVEAGELTQEAYDEWKRRAVFRGKQWEAAANHCTDVMADANRQALNIVRGKQIDVFAENATYQAYSLERDLRASYGFGLYSRETVGNLLKDQPELLPRKVLKGRKDKAWNREKMASIINQGVIQGDGIDAIANRIGEQLAVANDKAAMRYARTAMTSAQNAGRMEMLHEAEGEGIKSKKKWLATLDSRTRDAHQELDGQTAELDEPFENEIGKIMFPGDPSADPANVYNCRCTLIYEIADHPLKGERRAYREWDDDDGHHRESYMIDGKITYAEWKKMKGGE